MVSPETVIFFVRASIKLGIAANDSIQQGLRDRDVSFPTVDSARRTLIDQVEEFFLDPENQPIVEDDPLLSQHWTATTPPGGIKDDDAHIWIL